MKKLFLLVTAFFLFAQHSLAQNSYENLEFLFQSQYPLTDIDPNDLVIIYNGKNYSSSLFNLYTKDYLLEMIKKDSLNQKVSTEKLVIPFGPNFEFSELDSEMKMSRFHTVNVFKKYKREILEETRRSYELSMGSLSDYEMRVFLSKKHEFLKDLGSRFENIFLKLHLKPNYKIINSFLRTLNNTLYTKAPMFVHSNTFGVPIYLTVGAGAALGKLLYDIVIARSPLKKIINPNFGFYFLTSFGVAFSTTKVGNRTLRSIDLFWDFERFKQSLTPVLEVFGGLGYGIFFESREVQNSTKGLGKILSKNSYTTAQSIPVVGMLKLGERDFGVNHAFAVNAPLYTLFLQNSMTRKYIHLTYADSQKSDSKNIIKNIVSSVVDLFSKGSPVKNLCLSFYK